MTDRKKNILESEQDASLADCSPIIVIYQVNTQS